MYWHRISTSPRSTKAQKHSRRPVFRPSLEALEDRQLLSVTSSVFVVDQPSSPLTLSGDVGGRPIQQQGPGSLTSRYNGTIVADWDLSGLTIHFEQPGTVLNATITGDWQPRPGGGSGSAPANYGGRITISFFTAQVAVRDLVVSGSTASPLPLSGTGPYSFPSTQTLTVLAGAADYNAGIFGSGREDLAGLSGQNSSSAASTFEDLGIGTYRLTVPVNVTIHSTVANMPATLHIDGTIVALAVLPVVNLTDGSDPGFDYATSAVGGGGPVAVEDPAASITRTPSANLTSMTITLTNRPDDTAEFLGYDLGGTDLTTNGYDPTTGQLVITGSADPSVYQSVLRTITYANDSLTPNTDDRKIQFVVSDGTNTSVVRTTTVSISAPSRPRGLWILEQNLPVLPTPGAVSASDRAVAVGTAAGRATTVIVSPKVRDVGPDGIVSHSSGGGVSVPFDKLLALDAFAMELVMN